MPVMERKGREAHGDVSVLSDSFDSELTDFNGTI
jgi:hypothetical protein